MIGRTEHVLSGKQPARERPTDLYISSPGKRRFLKELGAGFGALLAAPFVSGCGEAELPPVHPKYFADDFSDEKVQAVAKEILSKYMFHVMHKGKFATDVHVRVTRNLEQLSQEAKAKMEEVIAEPELKKHYSQVIDSFDRPGKSPNVGFVEMSDEQTSFWTYYYRRPGVPVAACVEVDIISLMETYNKLIGELTKPKIMVDGKPIEEAIPGLTVKHQFKPDLPSLYAATLRNLKELHKQSAKLGLSADAQLLLAQVIKFTQLRVDENPPKNVDKRPIHLFDNRSARMMETFIQGFFKHVEFSIMGKEIKPKVELFDNVNQIENRVGELIKSELVSPNMLAHISSSINGIRQGKGEGMVLMSEKNLGDFYFLTKRRSKTSSWAIAEQTIHELESKAMNAMVRGQMRPKVTGDVVIENFRVEIDPESLDRKILELINGYVEKLKSQRRDPKFIEFADKVLQEAQSRVLQWAVEGQPGPEVSLPEKFTIQQGSLA